MPGRQLYLDLLKRALTHTCYWPPDIVTLNDSASDPSKREQQRTAFIESGLGPRAARAEGRDWPKYGQTMVGLARLDNVQECVETILHEEIPGDLIEAGVWRGGVGIFMRGILAAYNEPERQIVLADSYRGLPAPDPALYPADAGDTHHQAPMLAVSRKQVARNFNLYGLLDDRVEFIEGWFRDTLPTLWDRSWSLIRIDGDLYESTWLALDCLYPQLVPGGYCIIDDYAHPACRQAVDDYRTKYEITEPVVTVDWTGIYWQRA